MHTLVIIIIAITTIFTQHLSSYKPECFIFIISVTINSPVRRGGVRAPAHSAQERRSEDHLELYPQLHTHPRAAHVSAYVQRDSLLPRHYSGLSREVKLKS